MEEIIELFGNRFKIIEDNDDSEFYCDKCSLQYYCNLLKPIMICQKEDGSLNRHFESVK